MQPRARFLPAFALALFAVAAAWYLRPGWIQDARVYYYYENLLADAFLHGTTSLPIPAAPQLLALSNPYDPAVNRAWRVGDASLYRGKFYLYYGPGPALALFAPFKFLTGAELPQPTAACAVAAAGVGALAWLLIELRRRYRLRAGPWSWTGAVILMAMATWLPVTLQRSMIFEVEIVCAAGAFWIALLCVWKIGDSPVPGRWCLLLGGSLAFCVASRITYAPSAAILLAAAAWRQRAGGGRSSMHWWLGAVAPVAAGVVGLLAYNYARFDHAFEFGERYSLHVSDEHLISPRPFNPGFMPFNAREYLLAEPTVSPFFPFLLPQDPPPVPAGYIATEGMHGILWAMPVHVLALAALAWVWRRRRDAGFQPVRLLAAALALCAIADGLILLLFKGATSRYITELLVPIAPLTGLGLLLALSSARRAVRIAGLALGLYSAGYVLFAATGVFDNLERAKHPRTYAFAAHAFDEFADLFAGHPYGRSGPIELRLAVRPGAPKDASWLVSGGRPDQRFFLTVKREDPRRLSFALQYGNENDHDRLWLTQRQPDTILFAAPTISAPPGEFIVRVGAPWFYPPAEDGFWDPVPSRQKSEWLKMAVIMTPEKATAAALGDALETDGRPVRINDDPAGPVRVVSWRYLASPLAAPPGPGDSARP